jgi:diguanylate cyclase (GGDEF)-like protein
VQKIFPAIHSFLSKQSKSFVLPFVLCVILLLGWLDYVTGFEATFSFFYLIPVSIAAWYLGREFGLISAVVGIAIWLVSNYAAGERYTREIIRYWNALERLALFILIVFLLEEFKRALSHERLLANTDHLTGIPNRREFYFQLEKELALASRSSRPLTIAYMDVDSFKQINDRFGHMEGDAILRVIAQSVLAGIRKTDTVARLGGDEFAVMFPNTSQDSAMVIMSRVQGKLAGQMVNMKSRATFSIGVVTFDVPPVSVDELLYKADGAMYEVKSTGKDGVTFIKA